MIGVKEILTAHTAGIKIMQKTEVDDLKLERLVLYNFKNYADAELVFEHPIVCLLGNNGSGKTNLLDAIHYLSVTKSFFNLIDSQNILRDFDQCSIQGEFKKNNEPETILCSIRKGQKKIVKKNFKEYEKLSDHIGQIPSVIVTPYDIELIWEGSEMRRKFLDSTISQQSKKYLDNLVQYNHALAQRNNLLKQFSQRGGYDPLLLEPWDYRLITHGNVIHEARKSFALDFTSTFETIYDHISNGKEKPGAAYLSELNQKPLEQLLTETREKDRMLERTTAGIHRDDLDFTLDGHSLKKMASQGQQKSFLIALKLAQHHFIAEHLKLAPILMLDDLFDKVDESRVHQILSWLQNYVKAQIFITDTHLQRIPDMLKSMNFDHEVWKISDASVEKIG